MDMKKQGNGERDMAQKTYNRHALGVLFVILDSFCFSLMTVFVRMSGDLPTIQKTFFRNAFAAIVAFFVLARSTERFHVKRSSIGGLLGRSICGCLGMICNFWAVDHIALADANILNKMSPFFALIFSIFLLAEIPDRFETITVIIAFIGAAFVVKPTAGLASIPALVGLLGGLGAGIAYAFVRRLGQQGERGPVIVCFFSIFTSLFCLPFMLYDYHPMTGTQWALLIGAGLAACGGQFTVTAAYKCAPAKEISVFDYSQVLFASIWGMLFFEELPDRYSLIGYVIIIATAIAKWRYTMRKDAAEKARAGETV